MASNGKGRHRADVEINVLESFEIRSRRSVREAEKAKLAKSSNRARKAISRMEAKALRRERMLQRPLSKTSSQGRLRNNQTFRTAITMLAASGLMATSALPAYAYDPEVAAMAKFTTTNPDDIVQTEGTQDLTVAAANTVLFVRGEYASENAAQVLRQQTISNYRAYSGPSAEDFVANPPFSSISAEQVLQVAAQYVGVPYVFGGANPRAFDCSGYVMFVFAQFGVSMRHSVVAQSRMGITVSPEDARPGDLVIFNDLSHNGIYAGNGQFYHAPQSGDRVKLAPIFEPRHFFVRLETD